MAFDVQAAMDATAGIVQDHTTVGKVSTYRRAIGTSSQLHAHLFDDATQTFNGAFLNLRAITVGDGDRTLGSVITEFAIQVEVFASIDDAAASEVTFRDRLFGITQAFNTRGKILAAASHQSPMSTETIGYIALADAVLLHYASLVYSLRGRTAP